MALAVCTLLNKEDMSIQTAGWQSGKVSVQSLILDSEPPYIHVRELLDRCLLKRRTDSDTIYLITMHASRDNGSMRKTKN